FLRVGEGFDRRRLPHEYDVDEGIEAPDPVELGGLEAHALGAELLVERGGRCTDADHGAVLGRDVENRIHGKEAAGAGLVLRDNGGLSRDMLADMPGDEPSQGIVAAARRVADDEIDGLAGGKMLRRL